jgi:hypothetical protein
VRLNSSGLLIRDCCGSTTPPAKPGPDPTRNHPPSRRSRIGGPGVVPRIDTADPGEDGRRPSSRVSRSAAVLMGK